LFQVVLRGFKWFCWWFMRWF